MPIFITEIASQETNIADLVLLKEELAKSFFASLGDDIKNHSGRAMLQLRHSADSIYEVTSAVLKAVKKTGKKYSFTVIKSK